MVGVAVRGLGLLETAVALCAIGALSVGCGRSVRRESDAHGSDSGGSSVNGGATASGGAAPNGGAAPRGGAPSTGGGGAAAMGGSMPTGGVSTGGTAGSNGGSAGASGEGGEGGQPEPPCDDGAVRCLASVGVRERCAGGEWTREDFVCAISVRVENANGIPCAVKADGRFTCWGSGGVNWLPEPPRLPGTVVALSGGPSAVLEWRGARFLLDSGHLWSDDRDVYSDVASFDEDYLYGDLCVVTRDGRALCNPPDRLSMAIGSSQPPFTQVVTSPIDVCVLDEGGAAHCAAYALSGRYRELALGDFDCGLTLEGGIECVTAPNAGLGFEVPAGTFAHIAMADETVCGIRDTGELACAGRDGNVPEPPAGTFTQIDGGDRTLCAIHTDGSVHCFSAFGGEIESPVGF